MEEETLLDVLHSIPSFDDIKVSLVEDMAIGMQIPVKYIIPVWTSGNKTTKDVTYNNLIQVQLPDDNDGQ